jgi:hypothetical protein
MKSKGKITLLIIAISFITIAIAVLWGRNAYYSSIETIDYEAFGTFGDFFGGFIGTIFAIIGVFFVYFTFKNQLDSQERGEIENRFFELLNLHNQNVLNLKKIDPDIFNIYIKFINNFNKAISDYQTINKSILNQADIVKLSYLYFFYGYNNIFVEKLKGVNISIPDILDLNVYLEENGYKYDPVYKDLGIYFRQLYQIVVYINDKKILSYREKYNYIKILRVRLNIEEQYLLFLNSFIASGRNWELDQIYTNDKFITKYNLIKNIPKEFPQIMGLDFREEYPNVFYEFKGNKKSDERKKLELNYK